MRYRSEESETSVNKCKSDLCVLPCVVSFYELTSFETVETTDEILTLKAKLGSLRSLIKFKIHKAHLTFI